MGGRTAIVSIEPGGGGSCAGVTTGDISASLVCPFPLRILVFHSVMVLLRMKFDLSLLVAIFLVVVSSSGWGVSSCAFSVARKSTLDREHI